MSNNRGWLRNYGTPAQWNAMHNDSFKNYVATRKNVCGTVLSEESRILKCVSALIKTI